MKIRKFIIDKLITPEVLEDLVNKATVALEITPEMLDEVAARVAVIKKETTEPRTCSVCGVKTTSYAVDINGIVKCMEHYREEVGK